MTEPRSSSSRWSAYVGLLVKVIFYSWPMLVFLMALHVGPVAVGNLADGDEVFAGAVAPLIIAAKLWGFFVVVMCVVSSMIFWCFASGKVDKPS